MVQPKQIIYYGFWKKFVAFFSYGGLQVYVKSSAPVETYTLPVILLYSIRKS